VAGGDLDAPPGSRAPSRSLKRSAGTGAQPQLYLGQEFHRNATNLVSCRSASEPFRDFGWGSARAQRLAERLIAAGQVHTDGVIQPVVPFEESADAYRQIDEHPETCIKLGVRFAR
jgi:threonine dehydrogenase-like Zn-dependent dehydrogenase